MQVLSNMISNAAKFSSDGDEVVVGVMEHEGAVRIFVRDRGAGIPPGRAGKGLRPVLAARPRISGARAERVWA
jgi:signal transduction histidine kinase